jgi:hypothetical protein
VKRRRVVVAVVAVLLAMPRSAVAQLTSPGPLSAAPESLEGDDHCSDCHESGKQVVASRCLDCHTDLAKRVAAGAGLHGATYAGQACADCHVEHIGKKTKLVRWPGGSMAAFDHDDAGWTLEASHVGPTCVDCHTDRQPSGKTSFLGRTTACRSCHQDPHAGRLGKTCTICHDQADWKQVDLRSLDHDRTRYPLTGKHAAVACDDCHGVPARYKGIRFAACDDCHQDPHAGTFAPKACASCHDTGDWASIGAQAAVASTKHPKLSLAGGHARVACKDCHDHGNARPPGKGGTCVGCHPVVHEARFGADCKRCHASIRWLGLPESTGRSNHDRTPYPLAGKHATVGCADCHLARLAEETRYRGLTYDRCTGCHADVHQGELTAYGDCAACHTVDGFTPTTFGIASHAATRLALEGRHVAVPCQACHQTAAPRTDLRVAGRACADCHADPHDAQFGDAACDGCHDPRTWRAPTIDHSSWPLTDTHATIACARCHGDGIYRGTPRACDGCHEDEHAGQLRVSEPIRRCEDCHVTASFAIAGFDHAAQTTYPLEGAHRQNACGACHPRTELANGATRVRYRLGYRACKDCHATPHRDAGAAVAAMDCAACHAPTAWTLTEGASLSGFDHDATGFPLRAAHETAACTGCHATDATPPTTCEGCHRDPHERRMEGACEECHATTTWSDVESRERHRRSRMPLTGRHAALECTDCHARQQEGQYERLPVDCYACHADDYRGDIHPDHAGDPERFPTDCARCHRTTGWSPAVVDAATIARRIGDDGVGHDDVFLLTTGGHRDADCASCHADARRTDRVRCDGCHRGTALREAHGGRRVGRSAARCLSCHPRGAAR